MALPKIEDARSLSDEELGEQIVAVKRELFEIRLKASTGQSDNKTHLVKHAKHRLGQLMTVETERKLAAAAVEKEAEVSASAKVEESTTVEEEVAETPVVAEEEP